MRKKCLVLMLSLSIICGSSMTAFASPEPTPDGGVFDAEYYAENNPDVVAALGTDKNVLYQHFVMFGVNEGRLPFAPDTDWKESLVLQDPVKVGPNPYDEQKEDVQLVTTYAPGTTRVDDDGAVLIYAEEDTLYTVNTTGLASNGHSDKVVNMNCWFTDMDENNSLVAKAGYEWKRIATYTDQRNEVSYRYGYQGGAWGIYVDSSTNMTRTEAGFGFEMIYNGKVYDECELRPFQTYVDWGYEVLIMDVMIPEACPYVYVYQTGMKDNGNGESVIDWSRKILYNVK